MKTAPTLLAAHGRGQRRLLSTGWLVLAGASQVAAQAAPATAQVVRLARLEIDPAQLASYKAALKEGVEAAVRLEPGVLTLYPVQEKAHPTRFTLLEIYASPEAYQAHLQTPHFRKYKAYTKDMVKSLELVDSVPLVPGMKIK